MHSHFTYLIMLFVIAMSAHMLTSCDGDLQSALEHADDNRAELEKVLVHFKDDPDPLKYASARFLIENMGYYYSYDGHDIKLYDSIYLNAQHEPGNYRTDYINKAYGTILFDNCQVKSDLQTIHADFLIKAIDEACDVWNLSSWSKDYDQSVFFNYVLPYRISNECLSDWRKTVGNEFPLLLMHKVISRRGLQLEAEDSHIHDCSINDFDGASGRKAVILNNINSSVTFVIDSERSTNKRLILKYTTTNKQLNALISVNGITIDTLYLSPARNIETFVEKWHNFIIPLNAGHNEITISHASDTLGIDYIQIGAIEDYAPADLTDFSSNYYIIRNSQSGHCITFDTASRQDISIPHLYPFNTTDSCQLLRLDYQGYPLWKICSYKRDSTDICLDVPFGTDGTLRPDSSVFQERYENRPFQQWVFFPLPALGGQHQVLFLVPCLACRHRAVIQPNVNSPAGFLYQSYSFHFIVSFSIHCSLFTIHCSLMCYSVVFYPCTHTLGLRRERYRRRGPVACYRAALQQRLQGGNVALHVLHPFLQLFYIL